MMKISNSKRLNYQLMNANSDEDLDLLFQLNQYPEVMKFLNGGKPNTFEEIREQFKPRLTAFTNKKYGWGLWKVCDLDTNSFTGWILVRPMDFFEGNALKSNKAQLDNIELGWRFMPKSWGKGLASEAAQHVMEAVKNQQGIKKFSAIADAQNTGSIAIMKKLGMQFIKTQKQQEPHGEIDADFYEIQLKNTKK